MGSFTFKWEHPAAEVYVTGTFDDWSKSVKLDKEGSVFSKGVDLPKAEKILYKFVVDGNWTTDHTAPQETDEHGNTNNVLHPSGMGPLSGASAAAISTVTPAATTAALAGEVPKEPKGESKADTTAISTVTPAATTAALAGEVPKEPKEEAKEDLPKATPGDDLPGAFPETPAFETPATEPAGFSVNPIPATAGAGNPIHLAPGEKVPDPSTITSNTIESTVKTDPESYEKSDAPVTTGEKEAKPVETAGGAFGVPPVTSNLIPESSLPIGKDAQIPDTTDPGVTIQSAAPTSTTAALAGQVPLEPRGVPEVVEESQEKADAAPEASANPTAVEEKKEVEEELKEKVPEAPAAAESGATKEGITGAVVGGAAAAGAVATGAAVAAKEKLPESVQKPIEQITNGTTTAPEVPAVVSESIEKANQSPEAAANEQAVKEKSAVEQELEKKVPVENETGEPAPTEAAATSATAPEPTKEPKTEPALPPNALAAEEPLQSSEEKLNAPATAPATTLATEPKKEDAALASGDVSPSTKPTEAKSEPAKPAEAGPATPKKNTTGAAATPDSTKTDKSKKRKHRISSFFGKLKDKF